MTNTSLRLQLSTKAIVGNDEAVHLIEQKERLEAAAIINDAPLCLDLSKAFLETVFKTILNDRVDSLNDNSEFPALFKIVKEHISFSKNEDINKLLGLLGSQIVNVTGQLRNRYGAASHGDDGYRNNPIDMAGAEFIMSSVDGLASCLYSKHRETLSPEEAKRLNYSDFEEFNEWLDEQFEGYHLPLGNGRTLEFTASQMIFDNDRNGYREMLIQYSSTQDEDEETD